MPTETELLGHLAQEILHATERLNTGDCLEDDLPTAADIARKCNYRLEAVKKKLRILKEEGLIQVVGMTPKRYRFNYWALKSLDPSSPLHELLCEPESPYFIGGVAF